MCFVAHFHPPPASFSELLVLINLLFALLPTRKSWDEIIFIDVNHKLTQPFKGPPGSLSLPSLLLQVTTSFNSFHKLPVKSQKNLFLSDCEEGRGEKNLNP